MTAVWRIRRWLVICHALAEPAPAKAIARHVGRSLCTGRLIQAYHRRDPVAPDTPAHWQRQRAYLSLAEERACPEHFVEQSRNGQIAIIRQIKDALTRTATVLP